MPKKFLSKNFFMLKKTDLHQAAKYHWEFKRRNEAYRLWWQQGERAKEKPEGWDERWNPDRSFEELIEVSAANSMEWLLSRIEDPELKKAIDEAPFKKSVFETLFMRKLMPKGVEDHMGLGSLTIQIHFDKIRSVSALREYVSSLINTHYKIFLTPGILSDGAIAKLRRSKNLKRDFEKILKAGDMRKKNLTEPQIAKKLFPKDVDREGAKIKVHQLINQYKKLVNGGYEEISYP
jgi:hypothetical protein